LSHLSVSCRSECPVPAIALISKTLGGIKDRNFNRINDFGGENLWVGSPRLDGGAWFGVPPAEYGYACIGYGNSQGGFYITIEPGGACCYDAIFADRMYQNWETINWCVASCIPVPTENRSWGAIKSLYE
jgi:hypothetical protein